RTGPGSVGCAPCCAWFSFSSRSHSDGLPAPRRARNSPSGFVPAPRRSPIATPARTGRSSNASGIPPRPPTRSAARPSCAPATAPAWARRKASGRVAWPSSSAPQLPAGAEDEDARAESDRVENQEPGERDPGRNRGNAEERVPHPLHHVEDGVGAGEGGEGLGELAHVVEDPSQEGEGRDDEG